MQGTHFGTVPYPSHLVASPEIVQFREMLQTRATQDAPPLENFPEEYTPLVAKLVHERSELVHNNSFSSVTR